MSISNIKTLIKKRHLLIWHSGNGLRHTSIGPHSPLHVVHAHLLLLCFHTNITFLIYQLRKYQISVWYAQRKVSETAVGSSRRERYQSLWCIHWLPGLKLQALLFARCRRYALETVARISSTYIWGAAGVFQGVGGESVVSEKSTWTTRASIPLPHAC